MGDYAQAEPLLRRALAVNKKALGPEHPVRTRPRYFSLASIVIQTFNYVMNPPTERPRQLFPAIQMARSWRIAPRRKGRKPFAQCFGAASDRAGLQDEGCIRFIAAHNRLDITLIPCFQEFFL
jgi:hypothetical protein